MSTGVVYKTSGDVAILAEGDLYCLYVDFEAKTATFGPELEVDLYAAGFTITAPWLQPNEGSSHQPTWMGDGTSRILVGAEDGPDRAYSCYAMVSDLVDRIKAGDPNRVFNLRDYELPPVQA